MTEKEIQIILYHYRSGMNHKMIVPNPKFSDYEADLLSLTTSNYLHEYEIKTTLNDYKADFRKEKKHNRLKTGVLTEWTGYGEKIKYVVPNYFWYVVPDQLITDVPVYAGLISIKYGHYIDVIKKAPRIHKEKLSDKNQIHILNNLMFRYWTMRINKSNEKANNCT